MHLTKAASPQFAEPVLFRVIRVLDWQTYDGWVWLDGYQLDTSGDAVARRSVFVQLSGLQRADPGGRALRVGARVGSRVGPRVLASRR
jgi:hypothetical protein